MKFNLQEVVRPNIWALKAYKCARDDYATGILLDANENAFGPSLNGTVIGSSFKTINSDHHLERYPDPRQLEIKQLLFSLRGVEPEHYFLGVGSDESIDLAFRVFCVPGRDKVLVTPPTYGMYSVSAQTNDISVVKVPLIVNDGSFQLNVSQMLDTVLNDPLIKIIFICSPGNPTGTLIDQADIEILLNSQYRGMVFVDEAYIDFNEQASVSRLVKQYPNLIVSQTLSKAFGLAGARLGLSLSSVEVAEIFNKTKAPYNISTPASLIAKEALSEQGLKIMRSHVACILEERNKLIAELGLIPFMGKIMGKNDANFLLVQVLQNGVPDNARAHAMYRSMAEEQGVVVRYRGMEHGCEGCLRITVGTPKENRILLEKLRLFL